MDPLGLPFEMYNHAGLFRTTELDQPVDASGEIIEAAIPALDGPVKRHRDDRKTRQQRTRRAGLRPPRLPLLDGPE
jgi:hypothetical protein